MSRNAAIDTINLSEYGSVSLQHVQLVFVELDLAHYYTLG